MWLFGVSVEADIQDASDKAKDDRTRETVVHTVLAKWLNERSDSNKPLAKGMFADPAARFQKG